MASSITTSGIASGIDTNAMVAQLLSIQKAPIQKLVQRQSDISAKAAKLSDLMTKLKALANAAQELSSATKLLSYTASSSNETIATVAASGDANPASYSLQVSSLAKAEKNLSAGFSSSSSTVAAGTLSISINGGTATDIEFSGGESLVQAVAKINGEGAGVTATLVDDGQGTSTSYRILLTASDTGFTTASASDAVSITDTGTGLGFTETVTATNAVFKLDDLDITRTKNSFSDLVTGVTFNLKAVGSSTVEIDSDPEAVRAKLQSFVDAYNSVLNAVSKELKVSSDTKRSTSLASDPIIRSLDRVLDSLVTKGAGDTGGPYDSLASIGVSQSKTGILTLDKTKFLSALSGNATSVAAVFSNADTGVVANIDQLVDQFTNPIDGALTVGNKSLSIQKSRLTNRISVLESRADSYEQRLKKQFLAMERTIALVQSQGARMNAALGAL